MKVKIIRCSENRFWYYNPLFLGKIYDVDIETKDGYSVYDGNTIKFIHRRHCEVVDDNIDILKHRWEEDKLKDIINETKSDPVMKQIKMSIETAQEWYKLAKENNTDGKTNPAINWLLENFTKEELEPKKGFTWKDSFSGEGFFITQDSKGYSAGLGHNNLFKTNEQALSALAFAQLSHIVAKYNEGKWFKVIHGTTFYYFVTAFNGKELGINTFKYGELMLHLPFCDFEDAKMSMEVNRSLWEQYWMIKK